MNPTLYLLSHVARFKLSNVCMVFSFRKFFDTAFVRQIPDEHFQHRRDHRKHIHPLVCFMARLRNHGTA